MALLTSQSYLREKKLLREENLFLIRKKFFREINQKSSCANNTSVKVYIFLEKKLKSDTNLREESQEFKNHQKFSSILK